MMVRSGPAAARLRRILAASLSALALAGCAADTAAHYKELAAAYERAGRLRTESAPEDAPFGAKELVRNFKRIAFSKEFETVDGRLVKRSSPVRLVKWSGEVRYRVSGDAVTAADLAEYADLTTRLGDLTGLDFREVHETPDIQIFIASKDLRPMLVDVLRAAGGEERFKLIEAWAEDDVYPCVGQVGVGLSTDPPTLKAMIVIKAETTGLLRRSCIHEELAQTLGLLNDDPLARPSIFNDDQEFALLTLHDEYLLRILYDPRLHIDMSADEGMPVVRRIVAEIGPPE